MTAKYEDDNIEADSTDYFKIGIFENDELKYPEIFQDKYLNSRMLDLYLVRLSKTKPEGEKRQLHEIVLRKFAEDHVQKPGEIRWFIVISLSSDRYNSCALTDEEYATIKNKSSESIYVNDLCGNYCCVDGKGTPW